MQILDYLNIDIRLSHAPQIVGSIYAIQLCILINVHFQTLCPKGTQKPSNLHSSPNCWLGISNIDIYFQLSHAPQIVGSIYPIQQHIFINVHFPTLCPKGTQKPYNLHSSPKCWPVISNINIYFNCHRLPTLLQLSPNFWHDISNINIHL